MKALWISNTGLNAEQTRIDLIANNMANINTVGFKFQDAFSQEILNGDAAEGGLMPSGVSVRATQRNFSSGQLNFTGNSMDLAIKGDGFFQVSMADDSIAYTKAGDLAVDAEGYIATKNGERLYPNIQLPDNTVQVNVSNTGAVTALRSDGTQVAVGQIELARFINPNGLEAMGNGLYKPTPASGAAIVDVPGSQGLGNVMQGFLEGSNVELANEMIKMIMTQRAYELNARVIQAADQMMGIANGIKR